MRRRVLWVFVAIILATALVWPGDKNGPRGNGMARTVNGPARGLAALGVNPANLGMGGHLHVEVELLSFGFRTSSELISYGLYDRFFTGIVGPDGTRSPKYLDEDDKSALMSQFSGETAVSRAEMEFLPAGIVLYDPELGGLAVAVTERIGASAIVPRDLMTVLLYGLEPEGGEYSLDGLDLSAWWVRELNISYGTRMPVVLGPDITLYGGVGIKVLAGYGMMETDHYDATIANEAVGGNQYRARIRFDYLMQRSGVEMLDPARGGGLNLFPAPAGTGFGVDLGAAVTGHGFEAHVSLTDIGSIRWKRNTVETVGRYDIELTDPFLGTIEDTLQAAVRGQNRHTGTFSTPLPTTLRLGLVVPANSAALPAWFPSDMAIALDYTQGVNRSMGNRTTPRVSMGVEYRVWRVLSIRSGLALGGDDSRLRWAVGAGYDGPGFSFGIATENVPLLFSPKDFDLYSLSAGFQFRL